MDADHGGTHAGATRNIGLRATARDALAKRAGRLGEVERPRADPLSAAMASAGRTHLRNGAQARIAQEDACKQELGKSGVGEKYRDNDRDTFMSTYIGAGKDCKQ